MSGLDTPDDESRLPHGRFIAGRSQNDRFNVVPNMNRWLRTAPPTVAFEHAWQLDRPIRTDAPSGSAAEKWGQTPIQRVGWAERKQNPPTGCCTEDRAIDEC